MTTHGNNTVYLIEYITSVVKKDIPALPVTAKSFIKNAIEKRLKNDPFQFGKPLTAHLKGYYRLRVGNYRVVYKIDQTHFKILIIAIRHRKDIYKKLILLS